MKEYGYTPFGLVIAFMLPGFAGLYGLSLWFPALNVSLQVVTGPSASIAALLVLVMQSLLLGLEVTLLRWLIFERLLGQSHSFTSKEFQKLSEPETLSAFHMVVEQHYRYHQFWGGLAVVIPIGAAGWLRSSPATLELKLAGAALLFALECLTAAGALSALRLYVDRGKAILAKRSPEIMV